jgi:hypothetical protein
MLNLIKHYEQRMQELYQENRRLRQIIITLGVAGTLTWLAFVFS